MKTLLTIVVLLILWNFRHFIMSLIIGLFRGTLVDRLIMFSQTPEMTPIESKMFYALRRAGLDPIPQYKQCGYRLDFAIIKDGIKLDVECDGKDYHSSIAQKAHDRKRTQVLNRNGWKVIRFTGKQIFRDVDLCVTKVEGKLNTGLTLSMFEHNLKKLLK